MRLVLLVALGTAASGCLPALPHAEMREGLAFDPVAFFEGRTVGLGVPWARLTEQIRRVDDYSRSTV